MLKASNWAGHPQRGGKETKGEKEELSAPVLEVPGSTFEGFPKRTAMETSTAFVLGFEDLLHSMTTART